MDNTILTEKDLERIFLGKKAKNQTAAKTKSFFKIILALSGLVLLFFLALNFNGIKQKFVFWYQYEYKNEPIENVTTTVAQNQVEETKENEVKPQMNDIKDNHLEINSIKVSAPITWNVNNSAEETKVGLENGLIHLNKTAMPGEVGNVFITGHSSNYPWAKGSYNNVFALLDKLVVGDKIHLKYQNTDYLYVVKETKVVNPDDISVLQSTKSSVLTLMTCTPLGTSLRRLIVVSNQIYPDPSKNSPAQNRKIELKEIPKSR